MFNIHKSVNVIHHINRKKGKNHMIISIDAESVDKIQYPFIIKNSHLIRNRKNDFNTIKPYMKSPHLISILNGKKTEYLDYVSINPNF